MMNKFNEIISGWKNYMFKSEEIEKIAKDRLLICLECEKFTKRNTCSKCGCYIPAKVRSERNRCPLKKWNK